MANCSGYLSIEESAQMDSILTRMIIITCTEIKPEAYKNTAMHEWQLVDEDEKRSIPNLFRQLWKTDQHETSLPNIQTQLKLQNKNFKLRIVRV